MIIKVLGIGSPFGDDQAGWHVVELLQKLIAKNALMNSQVIIERSDRPGIRLIELMRGFKTVFIIDAVKSGSKIGTIHQFKKENLLDVENQFSSHDFSILHTLQLADALNELPENISFYGIEIDQITVDSSLSQHVKNAIDELAMQLQKELDCFILPTHFEMGKDFSNY